VRTQAHPAAGRYPGWQTHFHHLLRRFKTPNGFDENQALSLSAYRCGGSEEETLGIQVFLPTSRLTSELELF
jgi:hypothetical protein